MAKKYAHVSEWYWVQEEPENMGAWYYIRARMDALRRDVKVVARKKSASPAQGSMKRENALQKDIVDRAFRGIEQPQRG